MVDALSFTIGMGMLVLLATLVLAAGGLVYLGKYNERNKDKVVHLDDYRTAQEIERNRSDVEEEAFDQAFGLSHDLAEEERRGSVEDTMARSAEDAIRDN